MSGTRCSVGVSCYECPPPPSNVQEVKPFMALISSGTRFSQSQYQAALLYDGGSQRLSSYCCFSASLHSFQPLLETNEFHLRHASGNYTPGVGKSFCSDGLHASGRVCNCYCIPEAAKMLVEQQAFRGAVQMSALKPIALSIGVQPLYMLAPNSEALQELLLLCKDVGALCMQASPERLGVLSFSVMLPCTCPISSLPQCAMCFLHSVFLHRRLA